MNKLLILLITLSILTACSIDEDLFPENTDRLFYAEYTQTYKAETILARHIVGRQDVDAILDTLTRPILHILTDFDATSSHVQDTYACYLTMAIIDPVYSQQDEYAGIGFKYSFALGAYGCPPYITQAVTDTLFTVGKIFSIGEGIGQIEISKNRNRGYTFEDTAEFAAGVSLATHNTENVVRITNVKEYSWVKTTADVEETVLGKIIEIEFDATLQSTYWGDYTDPVEFIKLKNGKGAFYLEYTQ